LVESEYSIDWWKCHVCGAIGFGTSARGSCMSGTNGISTGVGLPIISVRIPIWLWKYAVVLMPPLNQVEYGAPERITAPGLPSTARRVWMAEPTMSMPSGTSGSKL
jgi:hypothetical protein